VPGAWLREEQADLAVDKILEAASRAFVDLGVSRTRMAHIAQYAGCSRGTLYRYFKTRHELHLAYIDRSARLLSLELSSELARIRDPRTRLVEGILRAVEKVRSNPSLAAWFDPNASGMAASISRGSEVIDAAAGAFVERLVDVESHDLSSRLRARWFVRVVVSLLTSPAESEQEERAIVEQFVAPGLLDEATD
jgi:AcrR family transcriptional regulator